MLTQNLSNGGNFLKRILTYLYCIKYNEINMYHSDVQKNILCAGSHKSFPTVILHPSGEIF